MAYVAPSTVTTLQTYTSAAHNIIVNDIIDLDARAGAVGWVLLSTKTWASQSSVSFDNVFSSAYRNYALVGDYSTNVAAAQVFWRGRIAGVDTSASNYGATEFKASAGTVAVSTTASADKAGVNPARTVNTTSVQVFINQPFESAYTALTCTSNDAEPALYISRSAYTASTSFTGITLLVASNTFNGTASIYGIKS